MSFVPMSLTVNQKTLQLQLDPRTLLVQLLREQLELTGTHVGFGSQAGGRVARHFPRRAP